MSKSNSPGKWQWPRRIRSRIIISIAAVHVILMSFFILDTIRNERQFLIERNRQHVEMLSRSLSVNAATFIVANEFVGLEKMLQSYKEMPHLEYAMVLSKDGTVFGHTDPAKFGLRVTDSLSIRLLGQDSSLTLVNDRLMIDMGTPIYHSYNDEIIGYARIGLGQDHVRETLAATSRKGLVYILLAVLIGSVLAFIISRMLSKGLYVLIHAAERIRLGERNVRVSSSSIVELNELGNAFNAMVDEIGKKEKLMSDVVEHMPVGVWLLNEKGDIVMGNTNGTQIWQGLHYVGLDKLDTYIGWNVKTGKRVQALEWGGARSILYGETVVNEEIEIECFDKTRKFILNSSIPLKNEQQKITGAIVINVDITDKILTTKKLEESETKFQDLVEQSLVGVYIIQEDKLLYANPRFAEIFGYTREELTERTSMLSLIFEDDVPEVRENIRLRPRGKVNFAHYEVRGKKKDGTIIWIEVFGNRTTYKDKTAIIGTILDITVRKSQETKMIQKNWEIRERVKELTCLYGLSELANLKDFEVEKFLKECVMLIPSAYQYQDVACAEVVYDNKHFKSEFFMVSPWKQQTIIQIRGEAVGQIAVYYMKEMPDEQEGPFLSEERLLINSIAGLIGNALERKLNEKQLKESEEMFRKLTEETFVGVFIMQDDRFRYVNPRFEKITGYSRVELLNRINMADLIHIDDQERVWKNYTKYLEQKNISNQFTLKAVDASGKILYTEVIVSTIEYEGTKAILGTVIDITEKVEEEKRINKAVTDAQETERQQIGMELHDNVKQLLAGSLLNLEFLKIQTREDQQETKKGIENVCGYIRESIEELRNISHRLSPTTDSHLDLEEKMRALVRVMNVGKNIPVGFRFDNPSFLIREDIQLALYRILQEQFTNIVKYADATKINISLMKEDGNIVMIISDNGKGFDTKMKKSGIGLENIKRRTQILNGKMKISSTPGNGCELKVSLPLS